MHRPRFGHATVVGVRGAHCAEERVDAGGLHSRQRALHVLLHFLLVARLPIHAAHVGLVLVIREAMQQAAHLPRRPAAAVTCARRRKADPRTTASASMWRARGEGQPRRHAVAEILRDVRMRRLAQAAACAHSSVSRGSATHQPDADGEGGDSAWAMRARTAEG